MADFSPSEAAVTQVWNEIDNTFAGSDERLPPRHDGLTIIVH